MHLHTKRVYLVEGGQTTDFASKTQLLFRRILFLLGVASGEVEFECDIIKLKIGYNQEKGMSFFFSPNCRGGLNFESSLLLLPLWYK